MRVGEAFTPTSKYHPHKGHTVVLAEEDTVSRYWQCEDCQDQWHTANDPNGDLGTEETE